MFPPTHRLLFAVIALLVGQATVACAQPTISVAKTDQGQVSFGSDRIHQLSGITYLGGDDYRVVSDKGGTLAKATIRIDRTTGQITDATLNQTLHIQGGKDLEDVGYNAQTGALLVVDESNQSVTWLDPGNAKKIGTNSYAGLFKKARPNLGLESLAVAPNGLGLWVANEEALAGDGPRANANRGTLVRLQHIDAEGSPAKPLMYRTDPHLGADNLLKRAQSGVSGLVALPGGRLIVMERAMGGKVIPTFRTRLYLVETQDTNAADEGVVILEKRLLLEIKAGPANFEGITIGPRLKNKDYALLLISDDGGGRLNPQNLLALRLSGLADQPGDADEH